MNNLLHISSNSFPPLSEKHHTRKIWKELAKGFDNYYLLARAEDNHFHQYTDGNIHLLLVPNFGSTKSFFLTCIVMIGITRKYKINYFLAQCPIFGGFLGTILSKILKIPIMVEIHGMEYFRILDDSRKKMFFIKSIIKYSLKNATKVRSLSTKMTEMLNARGFSGNIVEIPNRVNLKIFSPAKRDTHMSDPIKVISVGRFVKEKSFDNAILAVKLLQKYYNLELTLIGGGPQYDYLRELSGNNENIHILKKLSQEEFVPKLLESDIYIQPSISEGMPRTIVEAMAMKLPIIASDVGAISGIITHGHNGILIEPGNVASLSKALDLIIKDNDLRNKIAVNGYSDAVNKYEWNKSFKLYRDEIIKMAN